MVRRDVVKPRLAAMFIPSRISSALAPRKRNTATTAPMAPHVPCGCIDARRDVAIPTRAAASYPSAIALSNSRPVAVPPEASAKAAGITCMPGWPLQNWLPSSISSVVPAVPFNRATTEGAAVLPVPISAAGPLEPVETFTLSAATSGSAAPPTIAPTLSAKICAVLANTSSPGCAEATKSASWDKWVMVNAPKNY